MPIEYKDAYAQDSQELVGRFTTKGKEKLQELDISSWRDLAEWNYHFSLPAQDGRTYKELILLAREGLLNSIMNHCEKYHQGVTRSQIEALNDDDHIPIYAQLG